MGKQVKIIYDLPGQMCNCLWSYLEFVSWAVLTDSKVYILRWDDSIRFFDNLRFTPPTYVRFPFYELYLACGSKIRHKQMIDRICTSAPAMYFFKSKVAKKLGFVDGWSNRESDYYFPQVRNLVRTIFKPNEDIVCKINELFRSKSSDVTIGVHIRRGDYSSWRDGIYYYSHSEYAEFMRQLVRLFNGKKVSFFLASNESVPDFIYEEFEILRSHDVSAPADLYGLMCCDLIVGPPSTFSKWAALMSGKPYHILYKNNEIIDSLDSFSTLQSHTKFSNGLKIW